MFGRESNDQLSRLEMLSDEILGISGIPKPKNELEVLAFLETALRRSRGGSGGLLRIEAVAWRCLAPLRDVRIRRQLRLHREMLQALGRDNQATVDSLSQLDDLVFARTFGRAAEAPIKTQVRDWVSRGLLSREDAAALITNRCLYCDDDGLLRVADNRLLWPIGVLYLVLVGANSTLLMAWLLLSPAPPLWGVVGSAIICSLFGGAWWVFLRHFVYPHRLIPRLRKLLPRLRSV